MEKQERKPPPLVAAGQTLGVIGAGVMGQTLIHGLLESGAITRDQAWATSKTETTCQSAAEKLGIPVEVDYHKRLAHAGMTAEEYAQIQEAEMAEAGLTPDEYVYLQQVEEQQLAEAGLY